jgi:hypothetical protein
MNSILDNLIIPKYKMKKLLCNIEITNLSFIIFLFPIVGIYSIKIVDYTREQLTFFLSN